MKVYKVAVMMEKVDESNGLLKRYKDNYIIGAESVTDVEAVAVANLAEEADGEFEVKSVSPASYNRDILEAIDSDGIEDIYEVTLVYTEEDVDAIRRGKCKHLVIAQSIAKAEDSVLNLYGDDYSSKKISAASLTNYKGIINLDSNFVVETKKGFTAKKV